jgi:hypothetical protein
MGKINFDHDRIGRGSTMRGRFASVDHNQTPQLTYLELGSPPSDLIGRIQWSRKVWLPIANALSLPISLIAEPGSVPDQFWDGTRLKLLHCLKTWALHLETLPIATMKI